MFGFRYYKADSATYVIKTAGGKTRKRGKGLSFFYMQATSSIAAIPVSVQEAPFIFNLQTADYQAVRIQGQISFRIVDPEKIADVLNFNLKADGQSYASEDPLKLTDRVVRAAQSIVQNKVQSVTLRDSLALSQPLVHLIKTELAAQPVLEELGIALVDTSVAAITPSPEASKALEAPARESILKEADDAIYARRKSAVEQERTIKDAELQTELAIQQKEQEIAESRINNERAIMRGNAQTEQERIKTEIEAENQRKDLVLLNVENNKQEADSEAYAIAARMKAFSELPVENLKAMALANMQPEQMMAMALETMAQNAGKIGELNIGPEMFSSMMKKAVR
ncbi:SPFH domain-containing protein [Marinimicrobium sp. ABcell2]|uniref:SPFH domain-containing protein n=1 Tax=Marinimicrobium sp. ABcell2 TaxID=3069751 RepID=UPI0027B2BF18|nr:SPFH domain-containing protein [Marinimicrobium sp. ABcell2]MDQ2077477.1 SPFH domain-containing protein [Marinimicrobium sp. ABcell2]